MSNTGESTTMVSMRLPNKMLELLDNDRTPMYASRAEYIRHAIIDKLRVNNRSSDHNHLDMMMSDTHLALMQQRIMQERSRRISVYHQRKGYLQGRQNLLN